MKWTKNEYGIFQMIYTGFYYRKPILDKVIAYNTSSWLFQNINNNLRPYT